MLNQFERKCAKQKGELVKVNTEGRIELALKKDALSSLPFSGILQVFKMKTFPNAAFKHPLQNKYLH